MEVKIEEHLVDATQTIGAYEVLETIGTGGMGVVYKVRHKGSNAVLAMKILRGELTDDPINIKRFQQELKTTSLLNHPNVVPIYDSGIAEDGRPFFVMEYLEGSTLEEILAEEGFLDVDRFVQIFSQVCDALMQAHEKRVVHRDLKPSNIMVTITDTGYELVKVLDFGIARVFQKAPKDGARLTQLGDVLGSPLYMSPEQCLSQKLDERSDVYSLGVVMYEALAGVPPFAGESPVEIIMGHLQQRAANFHSIRPDFNIPSDLENLVFSCLEKEAPLRPAKVEDVANELKRISSSRGSNGFVYAFKQIPRRFKHRIKRQLRNVVESRKHWLKPAAAMIALSIGAYSYMQYTAPKPDSKYFQQRAESALIAGDYEGVQENWQKAINIAKANHATNDQLAQLYEHAGEDMVSRPYKQIEVSSQYTSWDAVSHWKGENYSTDRNHNYGPASEFLVQALPLVEGRSADKIRVLDKLAALAKSMNDSKAEESYLRKRIDISSASQSSEGPLKELASLVTAQGGRDAEAEELWKRELRLEELQHNSPYPSAMEPLADFYHHVGKYQDEEKLRRQMLGELKSLNENDGYKYQIEQQLQQLATCLRKQNRMQEAEQLSKEALRYKS